MVIIVAALIIIGSILGILALGNKAMARKEPLRITIGECTICGNGVIEYTSWEDSEAKFTHDEFTPTSARNHEPVLPEFPEVW